VVYRRRYISTKKEKGQKERQKEQEERNNEKIKTKYCQVFGLSIVIFIIKLANDWNVRTTFSETLDSFTITYRTPPGFPNPYS
jgi:hypothetical protein